VLTKYKFEHVNFENRKKVTIYLIALIALCLLAVCLFSWIREDYVSKILTRLALIIIAVYLHKNLIISIVNDSEYLETAPTRVKNDGGLLMKFYVSSSILLHYMTIFMALYV